MNWLKQMLAKISKPEWHPVLKTVANHHDRMGKLNLMWVICGKPTYLNETFFEANKAEWYVAWRMGEARVDGIPLSEYATLLTPPEFLALLHKHPQVAERFLPMHTWDTLFAYKSNARSKPPKSR